ncbi:MAG: putative PolB exonuclease-like 3'-5' exonuclease [Gammaproteobacteria bacterium]|jgi:predicted PolB exonuclease-like 3'-5' exonuclease
MNVFVFDIETIPDIDGSRRLHDLHGLSDDDVARAMFHMRRQKAGTDFLRQHLHKIVAISAVLRAGNQFKVWSLGTAESSERDLLERFFSGIERYTPKLVSWNGSGFDLPVIHYRSLLYPINAGHYWENGQNDTSFRYNNYLSRFHDRHTDLMDVLAAYQPRASAPLDEIAGLCGFPGKMGMSGDKVWDAYQQGNIQSIRDYCETDVLNTFLVYLNFERSRGNLDQTQYLSECQLVRDHLKASEQDHLIDFEAAWVDLDG